MITCRVCNSQVYKKLELIGVPKDVQHLLSEIDDTTSYTTNIQIYECNGCGLIQAPFKLNEDYYEDYLMSTTFSNQLTEYLDGLAEELIYKYSLKNAKVLDVGAGDGAFMIPFQRKGVDVEGIEPSDKSRKVAHDLGLTVYPGYMNDNTQLPNKYDAFVSRQVFEHVDDISGMFRGIKQHLKPGGIGLIEVPSLEKALKDNRFFDFFPDHINYYSLKSLSTVCELNGFQVIEAKHTMYDEYNTVIIRYREDTDFTNLLNARQHLIEQINMLGKISKDRNETFAIWGSGAKGLSIMGLLNQENLTYVIDSDPNKVNRYIPATKKQVLSTDILLTNKVDNILISAIAYQTTILKKLKEHYNFSGKIWIIKNDNIVEADQ